MCCILENKKIIGINYQLSLVIREIQSNPRIDWIMLHKIAATYRYLKHQETLQALLAKPKTEVTQIFFTNL